MQTTIDTKQDIFSILYQNRSHLITLGVRRIGLFDSFVRGEQRNDVEYATLPSTAESSTGRKKKKGLATRSKPF
jgi:predicted nucleotidyltransferase